MEECTHSSSKKNKRLYRYVTKAHICALDSQRVKHFKNQPREVQQICGYGKKNKKVEKQSFKQMTLEELAERQKN